MHIPQAPIPIVFEPIFKTRPWGGQRLASICQKRIPEGLSIGESWELASLPEAESRVARGPCAGRTLLELTTTWGAKLTGGAALVESRFPLLIKFLDATRDLSIQLHPRPIGDPSCDAGRIKHEAWVVLHAEPQARIFAGCREGVSAADFQQRAGSGEVVELLQPWRARAGDCYYLPSGIPHCLGAGIVVAEVQTPSDVTYRIYDWDRPGLDGVPRELHVETALANLRLDVRPADIVQPRRHVSSGLATVTQLCQCERFTIDRAQMSEGYHRTIATFEPVVWIVLAGQVALRSGREELALRAGDVALIPADNGDVRALVTEDVTLLEVMIPVPGTA